MMQLVKAFRGHDINKRQNFTANEKEEFLNLIEKNISIIEDKSIGRSSILNKQYTWDKITHQFNMIAGENGRRTQQQLRTLYLNLKRRGNRRIKAIISGLDQTDENHSNDEDSNCHQSVNVFNHNIIIKTEDNLSNDDTDNIVPVDVTKIKIEPDIEVDEDENFQIKVENDNTENPTIPDDENIVAQQSSPSSQNETNSSQTQAIPRIRAHRNHKRLKFRKLRKASTHKLKNSFYLERIRLARFERESKAIQHKLDVRLKELQILELENKLRLADTLN